MSDLLNMAIVQKSDASSVKITYRGGITGWMTVIVWETEFGRATEEISWNLFSANPTITPAPIILPSDQYFDLVCDTEPESRLFGGIPDDAAVRSEIVSLLAGDRGAASYSVRYDQERRGWVAVFTPWPLVDAAPVETFWYLRRHVLDEVTVPGNIMDEVTRFPTSRYVLRMGQAEVVREFDTRPLDSDVRRAIRDVLDESGVDVSITSGFGVTHTWDAVMTGPDWDGQVSLGLYEVDPWGGQVLIGPAETRFVLRSTDSGWGDGQGSPCALSGPVERVFESHPTATEICDAVTGMFSGDGGLVFLDPPRLSVTYREPGELLVRMVPRGVDASYGASELEVGFALVREDNGQGVGLRVE